LKNINNKDKYIISILSGMFSGIAVYSIESLIDKDYTFQKMGIYAVIGSGIGAGTNYLIDKIFY